jgi:hypothetical protein
MLIALNELPDDVDALKNLVLEKAARNAQLTTENERYQSQVVILQEQLNIALAKRFASRSEQLSPDQIRLFPAIAPALPYLPPSMAVGRSRIRCDICRGQATRRHDIGLISSQKKRWSQAITRAVAAP